MIVVDSNVIAYLYLPSAQSSLAERLRARDQDWAAPLLWRSELRNALARYVRSRHLTVDDACRIQAEAESLLAGFEYHVPSDDVLRLAADSGCSAYDCEFVALAQQLGLPLVTADQQLARAFPGTAVELAAAAR